ncbi:hypothetical protein JXM67_14445 [candidate division WOR-3 bacterium]|nr:hypothetical protein [candidate division WOR-3 bacterium]
METKPNQQPLQPSPSGKYVLRMLYEITDDDTYWKIQISDNDDNVLYKDPEGFLARFNVYWCWDTSNRVWLYNSDDGRVFFWQATDAGWEKVKWGAGKVNECGVDALPPDELYPAYVK